MPPLLRTITAGRFTRSTAMRDPQYCRFWWAELLNGTASWLLFAAQGWLLIQLTHEPRMVALFFALRTIPRIVIGLPAGALCERYGALRLLRGVRFVGVLPAGLVALTAATGTLTAEIVLVSTVLTSVIQAFDQPSHRTLVYAYAPGALLVSGVAAMSVGSTVTTLVGPTLLAPVSALAGVAWVFPIQAVMVAASGVLLLGNRIPATKVEARGTSVGSECWGAVRYLVSTPLIVLLIVLAGSPGMLDRLLAVAIPGYADGQSAGAAGMTLLFLAPATGALLGGSILTWLGSQVRNLLPLAVGSSSVAVISVGLLTTSRLLVVSVLLFLVLGAAKAAFSVVIMAALQRRVPEHARGRVMGL